MAKPKRTWNDEQPIYRQLMDELVARILDGTYGEGAPLPSVRQLASDYEINPLTAAKAYQELVKDNVTEKRRGVGFFVRKGGRDALMKQERGKFLKEEWPRLLERMKRMDIDVRDLVRKDG